MFTGVSMYSSLKVPSGENYRVSTFVGLRVVVVLRMFNTMLVSDLTMSRNSYLFGVDVYYHTYSECLLQFIFSRSVSTDILRYVHFKFTSVLS